MAGGDRVAVAVVGVLEGEAVVDDAEEGDEGGPGAEALVHRVGVAGLVLDEAGEEAGEGVVAGEERALDGEHLALLGVEEEDQPHEDGEQPLVDLVGAAGVVAESAEELAAGVGVGGLEALEEVEQGGEHLLGELGGDLALVLAALGEDGVEPLSRGELVQAVVLEQLAERRAGLATGGGEQGAEREGDVAGLLGLGPVDEADGVGGEDQAERDAGLVEQALELLLRRLVPGGFVGVVRLAVEVDAGGDLQAEQAPGRGALGRVGPAVGEARVRGRRRTGSARGGAARAWGGGSGRRWGCLAPGPRTCGRGRRGGRTPAGRASSRGSR